MTYPVYGVYLIPAPALAREVSLIHRLMADQFHSFGAGKFMPHCTVKGFFKLRDEVNPEEIIPALDQIFEKLPSFPLKIGQLWQGESFVYGPSSTLILERIPPFEQLHNQVIEVVQPFIAPDCPFSHKEMVGAAFLPHITLSFIDMPTEPGLLAQANELIKYCYDQFPAEAVNSTARYMQFIRFDCPGQSWTEQWGKSLTFQQIKGWTLQ